MKKFKRLLCGLLCLAMLLSTMGLMSCASSEEEETDEEGTVVTPEDTTVPSALPEDLRFNNKQVNILVREAYKTEFMAEKNGAVIDSAIHQRNIQVEDRLGVKLNYVAQVADTDARDVAYLQAIKNLYIGGITPADGGYHIITSHCTYGATLALDGVNYNLLSENENNYLDFSKPWHNQNFIEANTLRNTLYFSVGDANLSAIDRSLVTYVNKTEAAKQGLDDIDFIEIVNNDEWTLEYLKNLTKNIYEDTSGDNLRTYDDYYGLGIIKGSGNMDGVLLGSGFKFSQRSNDGGLELAINSARNEQIYSKLYNFFFDAVDGVRVYLPTYETSGHDEYYGTDVAYFSDQMFYEGKLVFAFGLIESARVFSKKPDMQYQILPLPKVDEIYEDYYTAAQVRYSTISLMNSLGDEDLAVATATLEALNEYSYRTVRPAYFDIAYKYRYASDETTSALFDRIVENITYDFVLNNTNLMGNAYAIIRDSFIGSYGSSGDSYEPAESLPGIWAQYGSSISTNFNNLIEKYEKLG